MKYSPKFFKDGLPEWKRKKDPIVARLFHRQISYVFSSIFVELGLTPNQVSFISLIIAFIACVLFSVNSIPVLLVAFALLNLWSITDSADGNMARSLGGKPYGDFIDATSSYFLYGMMFLPIGYVTYQMGGLVFKESEPLVIIIGAMAGSFDTMTRLFFQKMKNNAYEIKMEELSKGLDNKEDVTDRSLSTIGKIQTKIDSEFACGGTVHLATLLICILTKSLDIFLIIYFVYNGLTFLASIVYLIKKTGCLKK